MNPGVMNTIAFWIRYYKPVPGDVVVDVGAGAGEDLAAWSQKVGATGKVYAIEADAMQYRDLLTIAERNVIPVHCATTNRVLVASIKADPSGPQGGTLVVSEAWDGTPGLPCIGLPLDTLLAHEPDIALLKMNIEGGEKLALKGAVQVLKRTRNVVIAAHDFRADRGEGEQYRTHAFVVAFLRENGFRDIVTVPGWYHVHARRA